MQKHFPKSEMAALSQRYRANLINSVSGFKSANLIGTCAESGVENVAIFSSVVHLGADPALIAFVQRPLTEQSHTYKNIIETGFYTINHVAQHFIEKAHYTSARFEAEISEFEACALTPEYLSQFKAPFVAESSVKIGLQFVEEMFIARNNTRLIIGEIQHLFLPDAGIDANGNVLLDQLDSVCIIGLDTYCSAQKMAQFPYAKTENFPRF